MSLVSNYTVQQFEDEFSLDLGNGVRAQNVTSLTGFKGLIVSHLVGGQICSVVISFQLADPRYNKPDSLWRVVSKDPAPLTVEGPPIECINCPEHHLGCITDGKWLSN